MAFDIKGRVKRSIVLKFMVISIMLILQVVTILRHMYPSVDEVDLFVGGVSEKPLEGALLGQTFVCLVGDQFARLRRGDRFFHEEGGQVSSFSESKLIRRWWHNFSALINEVHIPWCNYARVAVVRKPHLPLRS